MTSQTLQPGPDAYFDYALSGILDTAADGTILRANAAAASITGLDRRRLKGLHLQELATEDTTSPLVAYLELIKEQGIGRLETRFRSVDGEPLIIEMNSVQVAENRFVHMFDDVTAQRRLLKELRNATEAAEAANQAKSTFLANISHEIRTPMNGIIGLSRLALMKHPRPEQKELIEQIAQSGQTLLKVINDLLDFSKLEAGKTEYEMLPFGLHELFDELAATTASTPTAGGVEFIMHPAADLPQAVIGDRLRLGQVLLNLLGNALKFTEAGTVSLQAAAEPPHDGSTWLRFVISDTGIGIEPEALERLFEPFGQADAATARQYGGTGLGLPIARELARGMGGDIEVMSQPGAGSRFTVRLPFTLPAGQDVSTAPAHGYFRLHLAQPNVRAAVSDMLLGLGLQPASPTQAADLVVMDAPPSKDAPDHRDHKAALLVLQGQEEPRHEGTLGGSQAITTLVRPATPGRLRRSLAQLGLLAGDDEEDAFLDVPDDFVGARVLVAEDNPVNQAVVLGLLQMAGIHTELATDGQKVLELIAHSGVTPDLVLMDVRMPGMDGLEATRSLRDKGCRLPIVGASAGASSEEQQSCLDAGMNDFLPKPIDADELWGCLTRWLPPTDQRAKGTPPPTAEQRFLGNREALERARMAFVSTHADDAARLAEALAHDDRDTAGNLAHRLKGGAMTIGADEIASIAAKLEQTLTAADTPLEALDGLLAELDRALAAYC